MMLQRLIVTGPNGAGKSYLAALLAAARPYVPVVSFDAIKLASNWNRRPQAEIDAELLKVGTSVSGGRLVADAAYRADILRLGRQMRSSWHGMST
ncbi:hypothetical protein RWK44_05130 [Rhizobium sp. 25PS6]|uniref:hypothetical protein n=1 Tax=Rhizobium sp. 25PS6 TaxID=3075622 RepID=UPI0028FD0540|nr:hypothetical protein [Rhizobium sp. 25PS6]MDU0359797.1 hypothetical protein [Rhizobium sp. 25PS6]